MSLSSDQKWSDNAFMKPVIQDDPLLMFDFEQDLEQPGTEEEEENGFEIDISRELNDQIANPNSGRLSPDALHSAPAAAACLGLEALLPGEGEITLPAARLAGFRDQFEAMSIQLAKKESELQAVLRDMQMMKGVAQTLFVSGENSKVEEASSKARRRRVVPVSEARTVAEDHSYFESYAHYSIHYDMLSDRTRTDSYRRALLDNPGRLKDALVLDIGCGTGILSMFAARAGARAVVGVDCSDIIYQAMDIVRENQLEGTVTLVKGRLEETQLPHEKFDIIVSEWMGYFLLFEGMLDSVVAARDRYLAPGGTVLPSRCSIHLAALSDTERYDGLVGFWKDVYGFKMSCMRSPILEEASVEVVPGEHVVSNSVQVLSLDINTCSVADTEFSSDFVLEMSRTCDLTAIIGYFDTFFDLEQQVVFSTGPQAAPTHWKQTVFYLPERLPVSEGQAIQGRIVCKRMKTDARAIKVALTLDGKEHRYSVD
jgi:protein arginine N-methyltransferase 3